MKKNESTRGDAKKEYTTEKIKTISLKVLRDKDITLESC